MSRKISKYNMMRIIISSLGVLVLAFIFLATIQNMLNASRWELHQEMTDEEKERFSSMALIPELKDHCVRYGKKTINYTKTRICVECTSCDSLPEKYRAAADKALRSDESFSSEDLNDQNVEVYTIEDGLPLADVNDLPEEYREMASRVTCTYFQVLVYDQDHKVFMFWFEYR